MTARTRRQRRKRTRPLRTVAAPYVVERPKGTRVRTRLHLSGAEDEVMRRLGTFLGELARRDLAQRLSQGALDASAESQSRRVRKQQLTAVTSSRWAGAITRSSQDMCGTGMRNLQRYVESLRSRIEVIEKRLAVPVAACDVATRERGYRTTSERFAKSRRLGVLQGELLQAQARLDRARPRIVVGGRRLLRIRNNLEAANLSQEQWSEQWDASRMFLTADGESGKLHGNETISVSPEGELRIKIPAALVEEFGLGSHFTLSTPVSFNHRSVEWGDRTATRQAVRYDITYDPERGRWYLDASWVHPEVPLPPLWLLQNHPCLAIDLNGDHLAGYVVDRYGNPVGTPLTVPLDLDGLPASTRDARLRDAVTELLNYAEAHQCASIAIEDLGFTEARKGGRDSRGANGQRGKRGKRFRRTVAGIPTAQFRARLAGMSAARDLWIIAVDPAYTSQWGREHWLKPLRQQAPQHAQHDTSASDSATAHHAAAVAIGRRAGGHRVRRKAPGPRSGQRTAPGQPAEAPPSSPPARASRPGQARPRAANPPGPSGTSLEAAPNTVRGAPEQGSLLLIG